MTISFTHHIEYQTNVLTALYDPNSQMTPNKRLLKRRALIETEFDELKNICQIEHARHCSHVSFMSNLVAGLMAYCHQSKKPTLKDVLIEHSLPQIS